MNTVEDMAAQRGFVWESITEKQFLHLSLSTKDRLAGEGILLFVDENRMAILKQQISSDGHSWNFYQRR